MADDRGLADLLRQGGRRSTVQRLKVASVLRDASGHRTVEELYALLQADEVGASFPLSTIYRALEALKELRLVAEIDLGGRSAFEWVDVENPHHHLSCVRCGAERDLNPRLMANLSEAIQEATGFTAFLDHMAIDGVCKACLAKEQPRATAAAKVRD